MRKNENKKDNFLIVTNVINVSEQHSRDFSHQISWMMLIRYCSFQVL